MNRDKCPNCGEIARIELIGPTIDREVECAICGTFRVTEDLLFRLEDPKELANKRWILSGRLRNIAADKPVLLTTENIDKFLDQSGIPQTVNDKIDMLLSYIEKRSKFAGDKVRINSIMDYPVVYSRNSSEFEYIINILYDNKLIDGYRSKERSTDYLLTYKGYNRLSDITHRKIESDKVFVAMWFDPKMDEAWKTGFKQAIEDERIGLRAIRVDKEQFTEKICDKIEAEIPKCRFLIADVTRFRSGVFYEAGIAKGLGLEVIWTCSKEWEKKISKHFDTRQYPHILWDSPEDLKEQLITKIEALRLTSVNY